MCIRDRGQPTAYYYNYIDTVAPHLAAEMMNFMGYNAGNMGNHDVETGRTVFDLSLIHIYPVDA